MLFRYPAYLLTYTIFFSLVALPLHAGLPGNKTTPIVTPSPLPLLTFLQNSNLPVNALIIPDEQAGSRVCRYVNRSGEDIKLSDNQHAAMKWLVSQYASESELQPSLTLRTSISDVLSRSQNNDSESRKHLDVLLEPLTPPQPLIESRKGYLSDLQQKGQSLYRTVAATSKKIKTWLTRTQTGSISEHKHERLARLATTHGSIPYTQRTKDKQEGKQYGEGVEEDTPPSPEEYRNNRGSWVKPALQGLMLAGYLTAGGFAQSQKHYPVLSDMTQTGDLVLGRCRLPCQNQKCSIPEVTLRSIAGENLCETSSLCITGEDCQSPTSCPLSLSHQMDGQYADVSYALNLDKLQETNAHIECTGNGITTSQQLPMPALSQQLAAVTYAEDDVPEGTGSGNNILDSSQLDSSQTGSKSVVDESDNSLFSHKVFYCRRDAYINAKTPFNGHACATGTPTAYSSDQKYPPEFENKSKCAPGRPIPTFCSGEKLQFRQVMPDNLTPESAIRANWGIVSEAPFFCPANYSTNTPHGMYDYCPSQVCRQRLPFRTGDSNSR